MRAETADDKRCAAEWAAMDLKSGMGWELEVEVEVEMAKGPVKQAAWWTPETAPEGEQVGEPGWEGRPGQEEGGRTAGEKGGGGATEGGRKVERM